MRKAVYGAIVAAGLAGVAVYAAPQQAATGGAVAHGEQVFDHWCAPCHGAGRGHPGTTALRAKYNGSKPAELAQRTDLTPEIVHYFLRNGVSVMPFFRKTEVTPKDEADLAAYLTRNNK